MREREKYCTIAGGRREKGPELKGYSASEAEEGRGRRGTRRGRRG